MAVALETAEAERANAVGDVLAGWLLVVVATVAVLFNARGRREMLLLAVVSLAVGVWHMVRSLKRRRFGIGNAVFSFGVVYWFYLPGLQTAASGEQWSMRGVDVAIDNHYATIAYLAVALFVFAFAVGRGMRSPVRGWVMPVFGSDTELAPRRLLRIVGWLFAVAMGLYVVMSGGPLQALAFATTSRGGGKPWSANGAAGSVLLAVANFAGSVMVVAAAVAGCLLVSYGRKLSPHNRLYLAGIFLGSAVWLSIDSGTRSTLLLCVAPALITYFVQLHSGRIKIMRAGRVLIAVLVLLTFANVLRQFRDTNVAQHREAGIKLTAQVNDNDFMSVTAVSFAIHDLEGGRFLLQPTPLVMLAGPIPRVVFPAKPIPLPADLYTKYWRGHSLTDREGGGNNLASIVGQEYLNWGWSGVIIAGLVIGLFIGAGDRAYDLAKSQLAKTAYLLAITYIFISFRGMSFGFFFPVMLAAALVLFCGQRHVRS